MSNTILTLRGGFQFDLAGDKFDMPIATIAYHLSHINRFNGAVGQYSVAQHCVQVAALLPQHLKLSGLLHDATEAVLCDIPAPLKRMLPDYQRIESRFQDAVDRRFNVKTRHKRVREADLCMLAAEARDFGLDIELPGFEPVSAKIKPWPAATAQQAWLASFHAFKGTY